ncbi:MAG: broad specificity phosphatase PhoE [Paracoccaceae bacterium]|jgi:broad specificity phosphatase PhoE
MSDVVIVQHGQASFGAQDYDNLSEIGHHQASLLGAHLHELEHPFDAVICGDLKRHRQTLDGISKNLTHPEVHIDPRLNELDYVKLEAAYCAHLGVSPPASPVEFRDTFPVMLKLWSEDALLDVPETFENFKLRVSNAVDDHLVPNARLLVVSSGGPISLLVGHALGLGIGSMSEILNLTLNSSINRFEIKDNRFSLTQYNAVPHLDHASRIHLRTYI